MCFLFLIKIKCFFFTFVIVQLIIAALAYHTPLQQKFTIAGLKCSKPGAAHFRTSFLSSRGLQDRPRRD